MTNLAEQAIRVGIDLASTDIKAAGIVVAAGLALGALGILWTRRRERKSK